MHLFLVLIFLAVVLINVLTACQAVFTVKTLLKTCVLNRKSNKNRKLPHDLFTLLAVYDFFLSDEYNRSSIKKNALALQSLIIAANIIRSSF